MDKRISLLIAAAAVATLALFAQSLPAPPYVGTSVWNTNFGEVTLRQEGPLVVGAYPYAGGKLIGGLSSGVLRGYWWENDDPVGCGPDGAWCGPVVLVFAADGKSFYGYYDKASRGKATTAQIEGQYQWTGTLVSGAIQPKP